MSAGASRRTPAAADLVAADRALEQVISLLGHDLRSAARVIAEQDRARADDLYQEALIHLWELGPARFAPEDMAYLRSSAVRRMLFLARREKSRRTKLPIVARFR